MNFELSRTVLTQIEDLAQRGFPNEICGFIGGQKSGHGQVLRPIRNQAANPRVEYRVSPEDTLATLLDFERQGLHVTAVYHSHPNYPPRPSGTDLDLADWPDACYLITGVNTRLVCETHAWQINRRKAFEVNLIILD